MLKRKIRDSKDNSSVFASYFPIGGEARAVFKHECLLQDYEELLMERKEKMKRLEKMLKKKSQLLAEVKFLRRKYQQLSTTQTARFKLKKHSHSLPSSVFIAQPKNPMIQAELPLKSRNQKLKEIPIPKTPPLLDLNKSFLPVGEEKDVFNVDGLSRFSREGGANESNIPICRDRRIGSNRRDKKKVSWQDQLTLRV